MGEAFRRWLLPEQTRLLPRSRGISIVLRTAHLGVFGILLGGHVFAVDPETLLPYLFLTVLSGLGLIALEIHAVGLYWLCLGKGIMVLVKLAILLLIPVFWEARVVLLLLVVGIASVGSHMPARYRHYSLLHRRVIASGTPLRDVFAPLQSSPATMIFGNAARATAFPHGDGAVDLPERQPRSSAVTGEAGGNVRQTDAAEAPPGRPAEPGSRERRNRC